MLGCSPVGLEERALMIHILVGFAVSQYVLWMHLGSSRIESAIISKILARLPARLGQATTCQWICDLWSRLFPPGFRTIEATTMLLGFSSLSFAL